MAWQTRQPAVLDALVARWKTVPALTGIVQDGPVPLNSAALEVLSVGDDGSDDGSSTEGRLLAEGMAVEPDREQFTVACLAAVLNGANNIQTARARAFEILSAASDELTTDITLGGIVLRANVQDVSLNQLQTGKGALAQVLFTVACDAFTAE